MDGWMCRQKDGGVKGSRGMEKEGNSQRVREHALSWSLGSPFSSL